MKSTEGDSTNFTGWKGCSRSMLSTTKWHAYLVTQHSLAGCPTASAQRENELLSILCLQPKSQCIYFSMSFLLWYPTRTRVGHKVDAGQDSMPIFAVSYKE
jgi:hypothetical protein